MRIIVPRCGEINSMKIGLIAFAIQCILVAFADTPYAIISSVLLSMVANLVYPSISSLVSAYFPPYSRLIFLLFV